MVFSLLILCLFFCGRSLAQTMTDEEVLLESVADQVDENFDFSELSDRLAQYRQAPLNINTATASRLAELFMLSAQQIAALRNHISETGPLIYLEELQAVEHFDLITIKKILPYITLKPEREMPTARQVLKNGKSDLMLRYGQVLQEQSGYTRLNGSRYMGGPQRYLLRYRFNYGNRLQLSFNAEKDAGEPFFAGQNRQGFDFYSGSAAWTPQHSLVKKVVIGDYALQFGQGLSLFTGLSFGKSADISTIARAGRGLVPYTSTNEILFFRGLSATIGTKYLSFTPFFSYRKMDAGIDPQTGLTGSVSQSGYHRTAAELHNRASLNMLVAGSSVEFAKKTFSIGGHFYHVKTGRPFEAGQQVYNRFEPAGNRANNASVYGNLTAGNTYFFAEAGANAPGGTGFLAGSISSLSEKISLTLLARSYGRNYHTLFNQAISEGTTAVNERGFYSGISMKLNSQWHISAYADAFRFPWLRYRVDAPSSGYELFMQANFTPVKSSAFYLRYRYENKQQNAQDALAYAALADVIRQNIRIDAAFHLVHNFSLRYRAEGVLYHRDQDRQKGFLAYQDLFYKPAPDGKFSASFRLAWFETDSYDSRIYAFENDVLYSYAIPVYFGHGLRSYLNLHARLSRGLDVWARYALFAYRNQSTVGSGLDEIAGSRKSDLKVQMRLRF